MTNYFTKLKNTLDFTRYWQMAKDIVPRRLPQGMKEFDAWATSLIKTYGFPDNDSIRFALAASLVHLPPTQAYKASRYFYKLMAKGAANEVAVHFMQSAKRRQEEAFKADLDARTQEAKKQSEATATLRVVSDVAKEP